MKRNNVIAERFFAGAKWCRMKCEAPKAYAVDIKWDTDGEDIKDLPERVEIPFFVDDEEIADFLSDEYGYCVFGFNIEQY